MCICCQLGISTFWLYSMHDAIEGEKEINTMKNLQQKDNSYLLIYSEYIIPFLYRAPTISL